MRLAYVDEAGISNPTQEPYVLVAAVIVDADRTLRALENYLARLVKKHVPEAQQATFIFHATEIFNGGRQMNRKGNHWTPERRFQLADELAAIPEKFKLPIAIGHVKRSEIGSVNPDTKSLSARDHTIFCHSVAYLTCAINVEHWIRDNASDELCLMVVEDNADVRKLVKDTQRANQMPGVVDHLDPMGDHLPFRKIKEDPLFQEKRPNSPLQVADFVAYVCKRILMAGNKEDRYDRFFDPLKSRIVTFSEENLAKKRIQRERGYRRR